MLAYLILEKKKIASILVVVAVFLLLTSPIVVDAFAGLGGYISEKMLGDGTNETFYLGRTGNSLPVLGSIPIISTGAVTNTDFPASGIATATLHGNLTNLNGLPQAEIWFSWGYNAGVMPFTTPVVTTAVLGDKTATITGFNAAQRVYYRFYGSTDGTTYGTIESFVVSGGRAAGFYLMWNIVTAVIAAAIFVIVLKMSTNPLVALIGTIIGIIAITLIRGALISALGGG